MLRTLRHTLALLTCLGAPLQAQGSIIGHVSGLSGPFTLIDFNSLAVADATELTAPIGYGVSFSNGFYGKIPSQGSLFSNGAVYNFAPLHTARTSLTIHFGQQVTGAAFNVATWRSNTLFQAFLGAAQVDAFTAITDYSDSEASKFWGFEGVLFDRIVITPDASPESPALGIDNLQLALVNVSTVPEPSTFVLMAAGLVMLLRYRFPKQSLK